MKTHIWDSPTRLFHWALVINIVVAWVTIENRLIELHEISGHTLMALLLFRILWGIIGSTTARFSHFVTSPLSAFSYLKQSLKQKAHHEVGHNPAGGWMVIIMLTVIGCQVITGLFANNDLGFSGRLADYVSKDRSDTLTQLHQLNFDILLLMIWVHLVAVFFYVLVKNDNLVKAMLTGKKQLRTPSKETLAFTSPLIAATSFIAVGIAIYLFATL